MTIAMLGAAIPLMNGVLTPLKGSNNLNCAGYKDFANGMTNYSYNSSLGTDTFGCLILGLYIPYILLAVLIGSVTSLVFRPPQQQQPYQY